MTQILHDDVGVIVAAQEPIAIIEVVLVDVIKGLEYARNHVDLSFGSVKANRREGIVLMVRYKDQLVAPPSPRVINRFGLRIQVHSPGVDPAHNADFAIQFLGWLFI